MNLSLFSFVIIAVIGLLAIGFYGLLVVRNMIKVIIALQLLVKGAILVLVLAGNMSNQMDVGQSMAITVIVADTIVAVIGMALAVQVRNHFGTLDIHVLSNLRK